MWKNATNFTSRRRYVCLPMIVIRWNFQPPEAQQELHFEDTSQTCFAAHASSRLFSGRNVDRTRESGGNRAYVCERLKNLGGTEDLNFFLFPLPQGFTLAHLKYSQQVHSQHSMKVFTFWIGFPWVVFSWPLSVAFYNPSGRSRRGARPLGPPYFGLKKKENGKRKKSR